VLFEHPERVANMSDPLQVESLGDHDHIVRFTRGNDSASFQLRAAQA